MPWEERNCHFLREKPLVITGWYTQQSCIEDCRLRLIKQRCGCAPHYFAARQIEENREFGSILMESICATSLRLTLRPTGVDETCNATGMECIFRNRFSLREYANRPEALNR